MPKTVFQKLIFGSLMSIIMIYGMEVYNTLLRTDSFQSEVFFIPFEEFLLFFVIVMFVQNFIEGPLAKKLAFKFVNPKSSKPLFIILAISIATVCFMCPIMSFIVVLLFKCIDKYIFFKWIETTLLNLPMALFWQLAVAGPIVRFIYTKLFSNKID